MSFNLVQFGRDNEQVLAAVEAGEVFGLLTRTITLPKGVACAVVDATGQGAWFEEEPVESAGAAELRFVRTVPTVLRFRCDRLPSHSGHLADVSLAVRVLPDRRPGGLDTLLHKVGQRLIARGALQEALAPTVQKVLQRAAAKYPIQRLVALEAEWAREVEADLLSPAFAYGLTVEGVEELAIESSGLEQELRERERATLDAARMQEREKLSVASTRQRAREFSAIQETLAQLREISAANPGIGLSELLRQFSSDLRTGLYAALLAGENPLGPAESSAPPAAQMIVLTSKQVLVFSRMEEPPQMFSLPDELGVFRSLSPTGAGWLIGAQRGVWQTDAEFNPQRPWKAEGAAHPQGGFNGAVIAGGRLIAAHTELGVIGWDLDGPGQKILFPPDGQRIHAPGVLSDGRVVWAAGHEIWQIGRDSASQKLRAFSSPCQALVGEHDRLIAGLECGEVIKFEAAEESVATVIRSGGGRAIRSLQLVRMAGLDWVLIADGGAAVIAQVLEDTYATEYAARFPIHAVAGGALFLAGADSLRARVMVWSVARPQASLFILEIKQRYGSSVQDVAVR